MTNVKWEKNKIAAEVQSILLVASLATLLGLMGWLLGGNQLALMLIAGVVMLYFFNSMTSPAFLLKFNSGRQLLPNEAPQLYDILQGLSRRAELNRRRAGSYHGQCTGAGDDDLGQPLAHGGRVPRPPAPAGLPR